METQAAPPAALDSEPLAMDALIAHFDSIRTIDWTTILVIAFMCGVASYIVKEFLAIPPMIVFVFPIMVFCGMEAYYWFLSMEQFSPKKIDQWLMWTILAASTGTVIGIGGLTIFAAVRERMSPRGPAARPSRVTR